ncbi:MAG: DNA repair protein RecN [Actinobacteria bacterium]|nr:DNA repair protein RecN [Actinomycetota bacterium]
MLVELRIENLLLIERAELSLDPGFNAITGETGAGKTVLAHAVDLLLGGKSRKGIVRPGAQEAYVEGVFEIPPGLLSRPEFADIAERMPDSSATEVALARRVSTEGRTRAYIEGRFATAADLRLLGGALVSFFGQHEHRKLTLTGSQLATLDGFCGGAHRDRVTELCKLHGDVRELRRELAELELVDGRRERELGLIEFELAEIDEVQPEAAEYVSLRAERDKLRSVDSLRAAGEGALAALSDDDDAGGASALAAAAAARLADAGDDDAALAGLAQRIGALAIDLQDAAADLRAYGEGLADDPERLAHVEERLDIYERLIRKHGGELALVVEHAERCREDRARLSGSRERIDGVSGALVAVDERQRSLSKTVSAARRKAAPKLAAAVRERLKELALAEVTFEISIETDFDEVGPGGADAVEFMIAPNPGIAPAPLRETASGGELSRVMLALLTASGGRDDRTFVFDEIDAGIGGHTARAVGERLRALGADRQVICITHLPQVASAASRHFQIEKCARDGESRAEVRRLDAEEVVNELCRMLGAAGEDAGARRHARELLAAV